MNNKFKLGLIGVISLTILTNGEEIKIEVHPHRNHTESLSQHEKKVNIELTNNAGQENLSMYKDNKCLGIDYNLTVNTNIKPTYDNTIESQRESQYMENFFVFQPIENEVEYRNIGKSDKIVFQLRNLDQIHTKFVNNSRDQFNTTQLSSADKYFNLYKRYYAQTRDNIDAKYRYYLFLKQLNDKMIQSLEEYRTLMSNSDKVDITRKWLLEMLKLYRDNNNLYSIRPQLFFQSFENWLIYAKLVYTNDRNRDWSDKTILDMNTSTDFRRKELGEYFESDIHIVCKILQENKTSFGDKIIELMRNENLNFDKPHDIKINNLARFLKFARGN